MSSERRSDAEARMRIAKDAFTAAARAALDRDPDAAALAQQALANVAAVRAELQAIDGDDSAGPTA